MWFYYNDDEDNECCYYVSPEDFEDIQLHTSYMAWCISDENGCFLSDHFLSPADD